MLRIKFQVFDSKNFLQLLNKLMLVIKKLIKTRRIEMNKKKKKEQYEATYSKFKHLENY